MQKLGPRGFELKPRCVKRSSRGAWCFRMPHRSSLNIAGICLFIVVMTGLNCLDVAQLALIGQDLATGVVHVEVHFVAEAELLHQLPQLFKRVE